MPYLPNAASGGAGVRTKKSLLLLRAARTLQKFARRSIDRRRRRMRLLAAVEYAQARLIQRRWRRVLQSRQRRTHALSHFSALRIQRVARLRQEQNLGCL